MDHSIPVYTVLRAVNTPDGQRRWDDAPWNDAPVLALANFHPAGSDHHPRAEAKMLYDDANLYGLFRVEDRYVVCRHEGYQAAVYEDSCVEFFVKPKPDRGYMNFEMSCGGNLLLYCISDWRRKSYPAGPDDEFESFVKVPKTIGARVALFHSMPARIDTEITAPVVWTLEFHIPLDVLEEYIGPLRPLAGQTWRANFNKCADASSHPHWATWAPIGPELNLHQPEHFGVLRFE
ncbi:MAG TPA: carbohydrate-binding family 9-like protein [Candidatus Hydrogenedentes bacterium]|nr:carbohydrate-binding family 9-like protein [Candidatus Hydrogenedentota bacterium]